MVGGTTQLAPPTEEEEFLKRNTDCVYFLASPLTCKKGSECEYRHSDIARVNPRDCWYWLNGNCLNPKCGFRHPPLDGLLGAEVPTPTGPSAPQAPVTPAPLATPKQGVACIFFQKGFCLKGHLCPFLHGPPYPVNNKAPQSGPPANPGTEPPKTAFAPPEKSSQEQKFAQKADVQKPIEFLPPEAKQVPRMQAPPLARNGGAKKATLPSSEEPPRYRPTITVPAPVRNEISTSRSNRAGYQTNETMLNGKEGDEYSREPTPGFDVLVDNGLGDSEYYRNEEQLRRSRGHEYDTGRRSADYEVDRDMYSEQRDYERYKERDRVYAWEDHRASSERTLRYPRDDSPDQYEESDLRHRIMKQRTGSNNGLRSVVSREHASDRMPPRRDSHHHQHHHRSDQGSLSSRLRGRIKIPGRSNSPERERQHRSRPSQTASSHGRLRDRIKGRVSEERRDYRGGSRDGEFTGPKRLSELKGFDEPLGKRKPEDDLSFEGPKPLSEILKRKRGGGGQTAPETRVSSGEENQENNQKEQEEPNPAVAAKETGSDDAENEKPMEEPYITGSMDEDALLDKELEAYDHKDADYDYEQIDGEDYAMDEGEEYEDEEGFGKKESDVYS